MARVLRIGRKILGIVLIVVNAILSLTSFLAVYSAIFFASNSRNYFPDFSSPNLQLGGPGQSYLYLGTVDFNNTGLFDFDELTISISMTEINVTKQTVIDYKRNFGSIKAGEIRQLVVNISQAAGDVFNPGYLLDGINSSGLESSVLIEGRYAFRLFAFQFNFTEFTDIIGGAFSP